MTIAGMRSLRSRLAMARTTRPASYRAAIRSQIAGPRENDSQSHRGNPASGGTPKMEPPRTSAGHEAIAHDDLLVRRWRVTQLTGLGIP
jgi:hypothetical protein